jgi:hypothetical protein
MMNSSRDFERYDAAKRRHAMTARRSRIAVASVIALVLSALVVPAVSAAGQDGGALQIEGWNVVGNKVLVKITNVSSGSHSGDVKVRALVIGLPQESNSQVSLRAGQSAWVPVSFFAPVTGVVDCGIVDTMDPVH